MPKSVIWPCLLVAALLLAVYAHWQSAVLPPELVGQRQSHGTESVVPQVAQGSQLDPSEEVGASTSVSTTREQVAVPDTPVDLAKKVVASHANRTGDRGVDTAAIALKNLLSVDNGYAQWRPAFAAAKDYAASRDFNPLSKSFGEAELSECQKLIDSYSERIAKAGYESILLTHIGVIRAIETGDCTEVQQLSSGEIDPAGRAEFEARMRSVVNSEHDENYVNTEGRVLGTRRLVYFTRASNPAFFKCRDDQDFLKAELQVALRTYFLRR